MKTKPFIKETNAARIVPLTDFYYKNKGAKDRFLLKNKGAKDRFLLKNKGAKDRFLFKKTRGPRTDFY